MGTWAGFMAAVDFDDTRAAHKSVSGSWVACVELAAWGGAGTRSAQRGACKPCTAALVSTTK